MEIPSPAAGVVKELKVKVGDKVSKGAPILVLEGGEQRAEPRARTPQAPRPQRAGAAGRRRRAGGGRATPRPVPREPREETGAQAARQPVGAQVRARARRRPARRCRAAGPKGRILHADVQAFVKGALSGTPRSSRLQERRRRAAVQPAGVAGGRLRQVRPDRDEAAVAHPEALRAQPAPQLGHDPARHAVRRGRHHRARGLPQGADRRDREEGLQADDARLPDQGLRRGAEEVPGVQFLARQART